MLFLVFPKSFEFAKFITSFKPTKYVQFTHNAYILTKEKPQNRQPHQDANTANVVSPSGAPIKDAPPSAFEDVVIGCIVAYDSDIKFNMILQSLLVEVLGQMKKFGLEKDQLEFVVVGTAGAHSKEDLDRIKDGKDDGMPSLVGTVFYVRDAYKFDRALLRDVEAPGPYQLPDKPTDKRQIAYGVEFVVRPSKIAHLSADQVGFRLKEKGLIQNEAPIFSSNMLMTSSRLPDLLRSLKGIPAKTPLLVEMETFDFFAVCQHNKLRCLGALRVVSDVCGDHMETFTRCAVSFEKAANLIENIAVRLPQPHWNIPPLYSLKSDPTFFHDQYNVLVSKAVKCRSKEFAHLLKQYCSHVRKEADPKGMKFQVRSEYSAPRDKQVIRYFVNRGLTWLKKSSNHKHTLKLATDLGYDQLEDEKDEVNVTSADSSAATTAAAAAVPLSLSSKSSDIDDSKAPPYALPSTRQDEEDYEQMGFITIVPDTSASSSSPSSSSSSSSSASASS